MKAYMDTIIVDVSKNKIKDVTNNKYLPKNIKIHLSQKLRNKPFSGKYVATHVKLVDKDMIKEHLFVLLRAPKQASKIVYDEIQEKCTYDIPVSAKQVKMLNKALQLDETIRKVYSELYP